MQGIVNTLIRDAVFEIEKKANNKTERPYLSVSFAKMSLTALYDTGADIC